MGRFYYNASRVIEASIGEPLLSADLGDMVASLDESRKTFEMTTNGILLDEANRLKFLGRNVLLSVSIDAASAQGYAKYRNDRFETVIDNLRQLCRSKRHFRNLPWVVVVFIAMPSNLGEIERFLDLMEDVGVDLIKVKSLYAYSNLRDRVVRRAGGVFRYRDEILGLEQFKEVYRRSAEAAKERGLVLVTDINVNQENASGREPLCRLPWETMYATTNGPNICQYSRYRPLTDWRAVNEYSVENFLESIWNGEEYRQIRAALAQHRLPERCREALACPVTQWILGDA
jgi:MoaA/NifB/PqqE/SkfB family radical SAM enzyme